MHEDLEAQLREAFAQRAAQLPDDAAARVRAVDYRPRTGLRPRVAAGILAGGGVSAGAAIAAVTLSVGTTTAFAGWSPTPTAPASGETAGAVSSCESQQDSAPAGPGSPAPNGMSSPDWQVLVTDTRGPFTVVVLSDGGRTASCFTAPAFDVNTSSFAPQEMAPTSGAANLSESHLALGADPYTLDEGRVASDITAVGLTLGDGSQVQATTANGVYVAWWPGSQDVTSLTLTTDTGQTSTQPVATAPVAPCPPGATCTGVQGVAAGGGPGLGYVRVGVQGTSGPQGAAYGSASSGSVQWGTTGVQGGGPQVSASGVSASGATGPTGAQGGPSLTVAGPGAGAGQSQGTTVGSNTVTYTSSTSSSGGG